MDQETRRKMREALRKSAFVKGKKLTKGEAQGVLTGYTQLGQLFKEMGEAMIWKGEK